MKKAAVSNGKQAEGFVVRVKLDPSVYRRVKERAAKERRTIHNMLRIAIEDGITRA